VIGNSYTPTILSESLEALEIFIVGGFLIGLFSMGIFLNSLIAMTGDFSKFPHSHDSHICTCVEQPSRSWPLDSFNCNVWTINTLVKSIG